MNASFSVREQYERYPYPPVNRLALPHPDQGKGLRYELGAGTTHEGIRILVAGAGTLEPLVVAQMHPKAREIVAVDISNASLTRLKTRVKLARITRLPRLSRRLPPLHLIHADLLDWKPTEPFDYILASNVLHHVSNPAALLVRLASWLKPDGILRVVTYPKQSRIWMRETSRWLHAKGLRADSPRLRERARQAVAELPLGHPVRSCFESQPETTHAAGIVDAFFHSCENPLSPLEWAHACNQAGLRLIAEKQTETSRSLFLDEIIPEAHALNPWVKLQILDDLLELCANPILWFKNSRETTPVPALPTLSALKYAITPTPHTALSQLSPEAALELTQGLMRAEKLLAGVGVTLPTAIERLKENVGPRVTATGKPLPGLSVIEYGGILNP